MERRQELNPRYSMRAMARALAISPSKLSEVMGGKKKLSRARAAEIAAKLKLGERESEVFLLSVEWESARAGEGKSELKRRLRAAVERIAKPNKTRQRNAWYFGVIKFLDEEGSGADELRERLGLTTLQLENARRFLRRINRFFPERSELAFEPASMLRRLQASLTQDQDLPIEAGFLMLSPAEASELRGKMQGLLQAFKAAQANRKQAAGSSGIRSPYIIHWCFDRLD